MTRVFPFLTEYSQLEDVAFDVLVCDWRFAMFFTTESEHFRGQKVKKKAFFLISRVSTCRFSSLTYEKTQCAMERPHSG